MDVCQTKFRLPDKLGNEQNQVSSEHHRRLDILKSFQGANGRPRVNYLGCFSTKTSDPSKAHASQDNVHLEASLLSVVTDGISSRQHIMYMYTCHCYGRLDNQ